MKKHFKVFCIMFVLLTFLGISLLHAQFYISGSNILDANGNVFKIRGISHAHCWYTNNTSAISDIASVGANAVRIVCSNGVRWTQTSSSELSNLINLCKSNRLIAIPEVHDTTGYGEEGAACTLAQAVTYWRNMQSVLNGQENYVIINIGNEPWGNNNYGDWVGATTSAIQSMRSAGFRHTLMVDAPNWGQDWTFTMRDNAQTIFNSDPDRNTILSVHMYGVYDTAAEVQSYISTVTGMNLPLVIGEFGHNHSDGNPDEDAIMSYAQQYGIGWIAWSWSGNGGGVEYLDLVNSFNVNSPTSWGTRVFNGANGLSSTSTICSVYTGETAPPPTATPIPTETPTPSPTPTSEPTIGPTSAPGSGDGLLGEYYNDTNLSNLVYTTVDPVIDINWGGGSPVSAVPNDQFSARWTGKIEATMTEEYNIYTQSDDGMRVWIAGQPVIDDWNDHAASTEYEQIGTINMQMGAQYDIMIEYYENGGDAVVHLWWETMFLPREIIPQSQLYSGGAPTPVPIPTATPTPTPTATPQDTPLPGNTGDANGDGNINIVDALLTAQHYVGLDPADFIYENADTNCDSNVNIVDALIVAQYYVGLIQGFCL